MSAPSGPGPEGFDSAPPKTVDLPAPTAWPMVVGFGATLLTAGLCTWLGLVSWTTLFGSEDEPLFEAGVYVGIPKSRRADTPWIEYLEDHRITAEIGVYPAKDPLFVALDAGFRGRLFSFEESQATWTDYLLAVQKSMRDEGRRVEDGGRYELLVADRSGRVGLYVLQPRAE